MQKKKGNTKKTQKVAWDNLIVAKSDSLPKGVFFLFVSAAQSVKSAANKKATSMGVPGGISVLRQYPLSKTSGKRLFSKMMRSLKRFPYGGYDGFVTSSINAISRKYSELSSKDPDQIALRASILEEQVADQLRLLDDITNQHADIKSKIGACTAELEVLEEKKLSLDSEIETLEQQYQKKNDQIDEIVYLWGDRSALREEIDELETRIEELRSEHATESEVVIKERGQ